MNSELMPLAQVEAPLPEDLERAWVAARFPSAAVAVIHRPDAGGPAAESWYGRLLRQAGRAEPEEALCPFAAAVFPGLAEAEAFARAARHALVTLYDAGEARGAFAGGEPV